MNSTNKICNNNNNNAVHCYYYYHYHYYGRLKDLILAFKIPMGMQRNFFDVYIKFGYAPSKTFASPGLRG
jgi:hypothetical protein